MQVILSSFHRVRFYYPAFPRILFTSVLVLANSYTDERLSFDFPSFNERPVIWLENLL